jgi:hypothetical protein
MQQAKQRVQQRLNEDAMSGGTTDADSLGNLTTTGEATADAFGLTTDKTMPADDEASVPPTARSVGTPRSK